MNELLLLIATLPAIAMYAGAGAVGEALGYGRKMKIAFLIILIAFVDTPASAQERATAPQLVCNAGPLAKATGQPIGSFMAARMDIVCCSYQRKTVGRASLYSYFITNQPVDTNYTEKEMVKRLLQRQPSRKLAR